MILKAESVPRVGDRVVDGNWEQVGTVFDVFGPVSSPYVAVRPSVEPESLVSKILYSVPSSEPRIRRKKRRK